MKNETRRALIGWIMFAVMLVLGITMIMPFIWTLSSSFKLKKDIMGFPIEWIPQNPTFNNYVKLWSNYPFLTYYLNTIKVTMIVLVAQLVISSMAAYAFARMEFPGRNLIFFLYLSTMMVPWHAIMIPQFIIVSGMKLYDTHWALILLQLFSAFSVFMMRTAMMNVPKELSEAAHLDGASEFTIMLRVVMPSCKASLATLTVFTFNFMWNDYMGPMIYLNQDKNKTIQLGLASLKSLYGSEYGLIMAGTICALIPMVIIYLAAQKYLINGITFNGVKA